LEYRIASTAKGVKHYFYISILAPRRKVTHTLDEKRESNPVLTLSLLINGREVTITIDQRTTLLDALRENMGLTGTKKGCDHGQCGACTVLVNGRRINSCLTFAIMNQGKSILTIEGLAKDGLHLDPIQSAFISHDAFQCGYCTPGQIMSSHALLQENPDPSEAEIRELMSGNICRCGAYPNIVAAIRSVARMKERKVSSWQITI
jgi:xanthine dehydrogenase YagT iron-sulfur-binding subunit